MESRLLSVPEQLLRCSCCSRRLPAAWFSPKKNCRRGHSYWCKSCKRLCDLRRFYRNRIARALDKIEAWEGRIAEIEQVIGAGRSGLVSASSTTHERVHNTDNGR